MPMRRLGASHGRQRGAALILAVAVLILGASWAVYSALGKTATRTAEREVRTGQALAAAKRALLGYAAQYAARTDHDVPGRLPCPEPLSPPAGSEGVAAALTCNANNVTYIGRLPWRTLGIEQLRDGEGEPLWYVLGPGFRAAPINPATPGGLTLDGAANAAVAVIIAPGAALNTLGDPAAPPAGCAKVNQQADRYALPFAAAKFLECGNATGSYANPGTSQWTNDRVVAVTANEVMDAIAGPVADRIQRQVMPALNDWRSTDSLAHWGTPFAPYASAFAPGPAGNDYCGDNGVLEGFLPVAGTAGSSCGRWASGSVSALLGVLWPLAPPSCTAGAASMQCTFTGIVIVAGLFSARVTVIAPNVAGSFRAPISAADVTVTPAATVQNFAVSLSPSTGEATVSFDVSQPLLGLTLTDFTVTVANLPEASVLSTSAVTNPRMAWFLNNGWAQHTYYAVSPAATANPGTNLCSASGDPACLTVNGLPSPANDKRFLLALMGRRLATQPATCAAVGDCLEGENASTLDRVFASTASSATFNDRIAACPFQLTPHSGAPVTICN